MKSSAFNKLIADTYTTPLKTVTVYARLLKEAGLLTTGARGRNAPDMTPLDAARITIALLATDSPSQCIERVQRFGTIRYSPTFKRSVRGYDTMPESAFRKLFDGETLEDILAEIFALPSVLGIDESCKWFLSNVFHLRIVDFAVLAELFRQEWEGDTVVGEVVIPFKGERMFPTEGGFKHVEGFTPIKGGITTERSMSGVSFLGIGLGLLHTENDATEVE